MRRKSPLRSSSAKGSHRCRECLSLFRKRGQHFTGSGGGCLAQQTLPQGAHLPCSHLSNCPGLISSSFDCFHFFFFHLLCSGLILSSFELFQFVLPLLLSFYYYFPLPFILLLISLFCSLSVVKHLVKVFIRL